MFTGMEDTGITNTGISNHGFGSSAIGHSNASFDGHLSHEGHGLVKTGNDFTKGHVTSGGNGVGNIISGTGNTLGYATSNTSQLTSGSGHTVGHASSNSSSHSGSSSHSSTGKS